MDSSLSTQRSGTYRQIRTRNAPQRKACRKCIAFSVKDHTSFCDEEIPQKEEEEWWNDGICSQKKTPIRWKGPNYRTQFKRSFRKEFSEGISLHFDTIGFWILQKTTKPNPKLKKKSDSCQVTKKRSFWSEKFWLNALTRIRLPILNRQWLIGLNTKIPHFHPITRNLKFRFPTVR